MANLEDLIVKPGPVTGSQRPVGAPNAGSLGGRPPAPTGGTASPMERLASEIPVVPMPTPGVLPAPGATPPAGGGVASPPASPAPASPTAPPVAAPPGITINVGAPQQAKGSLWPDAQATPSPAPQAKGSLWPDAQAAPAPQPTAPTPPISFSRMPFDDELAQIPEGSVVRTPWGEGRVQGGRIADYNLTEAGKVGYARAMIRRVEEFGAHPWMGDPNAPRPPVEPGMPAFNPMAPEGKGWS